MSALADRIDTCMARLWAALEESGRPRDDLQVVLATKTRSAEEIRAAVEQCVARGVRVAVAENRAQEIAKHSELDEWARAIGLERHFIGRIQTNKARDVLRFAQLIHSVDRREVIEALERRATHDDTTRRILLQVNTSGEESKGGVEPSVEVLAQHVQRCRDGGRLEPIGLMTIGAHTSDVDQVRASLARLRELREGLADRFGDMRVSELSMGMSNDAPIAIAEGATMVRVGSAIFGPRPT